MSYPIYYRGELTVTPALSEADKAIFTALVNRSDVEIAKPVLDLLPNGTNVPYYAGLLVVNEAGDSITPEEEDSREGLPLWLELLIPYFFEPRGYAVFGEFTWGAENDEADRGKIYVADGNVEAVDDVILNPGPSWKPAIFPSPKAADLVQQVVDSADSAGCSGGLTVVSSACVTALQGAIAA
jgi:hypothetical protein